MTYECRPVDERELQLHDATKLQVIHLLFAGNSFSCFESLPQPLQTPARCQDPGKTRERRRQPPGNCSNSKCSFFVLHEGLSSQWTPRRLGRIDKIVKIMQIWKDASAWILFAVVTLVLLWVFLGRGGKIQRHGQRLRYLFLFHVACVDGRPSTQADS